MATSREALLKKIAQSKASAGGNIIKDGNYVFEVVNLLLESKFNGSMFIAEFQVREAVASGEKDSSGVPVEPNKIGSMCSYVVNLDKNISAAGNAKALILALYGLDEAEVSEEDFLAALSAVTEKDQPARGMLIADSTFRKTIRGGPNAGKPFTAHRWQNVAQVADDIAARRKAQESKAA
jgi:hypothetical protein